MREIKLPIYKHDDSTSAMEELGIPFSFDNNETGDMFFYNIASIAEFIEDDNRMTEIHANGQIFICSHPVEKVREIIRQVYE